MKAGLLLSALFFATAALAADQPSVPCNPNDANSICVIRISVSDLVAIDSVLENAAVPHKAWGPAWERVTAQLRAQQLQTNSTKEPPK